MVRETGAWMDKCELTPSIYSCQLLLPIRRDATYSVETVQVLMARNLEDRCGPLSALCQLMLVGSQVWSAYREILSLSATS